MKTLSSFAVAVCVLLFVMGCGRLGGGGAAGNTANSNAANAAPARAEKAVDVPSLIGKSMAEVKTALGPPTREIAGTMIWEFPQGNLSVEPVYKNEKKVQYFTFEAKIFVVGGQAARGFATYDKLGDLIGIDTRGKTPTSSDTDPTGYVTFEKVDLNGKTAEEISFNKVSGTFISVTVRMVPH
ncbi:MAG: hypothetical protein ABJB40_12635 [Acidobacteriota bacterium]